MLNTKLFDKILTNKNSDKYIIANTYLHILNASPDFLAKYNLSNTVKTWLVIKFRLIALVRILQSIFDKKHHYTNTITNQTDVLFISHLTNNRQLQQDDDVYFGNLPDQLLTHNISSSIALINHTKINNSQVLLGWKNSQIARFVLSPSLDFLSEIKLYCAQKKSKKQLGEILKQEKVDKNIAKDIARNHLSSDTFNAMRIAKQVDNLVKLTQAKCVITTYEGHSWERLVFHEVKKNNPNSKCFGYQHAAVFEHQHALKHPLAGDYNPDIVLTSGKISQNIFTNSPLKNIKIVCLGSPKHSNSNLITHKMNTCLVIPEGFISECLILFNLSLDYSKKHPEQKFIWRLHPLLSFEKLKKQSAIFKNLPNNVMLSVQSLEKDINQCSSVLYRGSTAVVGAINAGLKPIYYRRNDEELSIDPIYQHKKGKFIINNVEALGTALRQENNQFTKQKLQDFAQDFYTPLNILALLKCMHRNKNKPLRNLLN